MGFDFFDTFWSVSSTLFLLGFLFTAGFAVFISIKRLKTEHQNNLSPRLTVSAAVAEKRTEETHSTHPYANDFSGASGFYTETSTFYYVTFQVASGDRMEFSVRRDSYDMLSEGDKGNLSFQGTRFLSFERT